MGEPYRYAETTVQFECAGQTFTAKGRTVLDEGWKAVERAVFGNTAEKVEENLDVLTEVQDKETLPILDAQLKEGKTSPPKHFTEDTLLAAMESAGADTMHARRSRAPGYRDACHPGSYYRETGAERFSRPGGRRQDQAPDPH